MMRTRLLMSTAAALVLTPTFAFAQAATTTGIAGGAATGAVVGGPVGAVVGGVVGGTIGAAEEIPDDVVDYVEDLDDDDVDDVRSVYVREPVVIGRPVPRVVILRPIPEHNEYRYAVVNDQRLIVEPRTRRVVRVID